MSNNRRACSLAASTAPHPSVQFDHSHATAMTEHPWRIAERHSRVDRWPLFDERFRTISTTCMSLNHRSQSEIPLGTHALQLPDFAKSIRHVAGKVCPRRAKSDLVTLQKARGCAAAVRLPQRKPQGQRRRPIILYERA